MDYIDLTNIAKKYSGSWVALNEKLDKVIVADSNVKKVYVEAVKKGHKTPTLFKVPKQIKPYFGRIIYD